ncbi:flagellar motor protein MotB [Myxococcota bacterium]|nr:flagellar motor protein MotB [Myxococcota bacterium]
MRRRKHGQEEGWLLSYADLITNLLIFFVMLLGASQISRTRMQQISRSLSGKSNPASLESIQKEVDKEIKNRGLQDVVRSDLSDEGLELSLDSGLVFNSGHATIRPDLQPVVDAMLKVLVPYSGKYGFAVEGHTDSKPVNEGSYFKSNWELSTARANVLRERLETVGIERQRVRVEGYADTKPLPEEALDGLTIEQKLARHRRVIVRIY